jgi:lysophospholipase L1-like esterase
MNQIPRFPRSSTALVLAAFFAVAPLATQATESASGALEAKAAAAVEMARPTAATQAAAVTPRCPAANARLGQPLARTSRLLAAGRPIKIVAIGSSSTAGAGASSADASYPSQLAVELAQRFPSAHFTVLNRGANGEEAAEMLARFDTNVIAEKPDLVLWQVGTNAVLRDQPLPPASTLIQQGVERLKAIGADVVLIDPQFAPKVIAKTEAEGMVKLIATAAKQHGVNLFERFALMRHWREREGLAFETFVSPDELHMNDWSYSCLAKALTGAIAEAALRPTTSASAGTSIRR